MKINDYVKTYNLCTGKIQIGNICNIITKDKEIDVWSGTNEYRYEDEKKYRTIKPNTIIWDKRNKRYVFAYYDEMMKGHACFSTVVVDTCEDLSCLLINDEKVEYNFYY